MLVYKGGTGEASSNLQNGRFHTVGEWNPIQWVPLSLLQLVKGC